MRLFLSMLLAVPGLLLLATPWLPLGLVMIVGAVWVQERSRLSDGDGLITLLVLAGGLGAVALYAQAALEWFARTPL